MFGYRADGRRLKNVDPIIKLTPMIMTERSDAQVFTSQCADWEIMNNYIREKRAQGIKMTRMAIVIAAYVRAVSQRPEINRFVVNKKLYVRNDLCVSFALLKKRTAEEVIETTVKLHFDPTDTIFTVSDKLNEIIETESKLSADSKTDKVAKAVLSIPLLPRFGVSFLKWLDRLGILPGGILEASPFHTSMFITNMASIKMNMVHHHIYNFGSTSMFLSMGKREERVCSTHGEIAVRNVLPLGVVIDERVCCGAIYAMALHQWESYMHNPWLLEQPPERVRFDDGLVYGRAKTDPSIKQFTGEEEETDSAEAEE